MLDFLWRNCFNFIYIEYFIMSKTFDNKVDKKLRRIKNSAQRRSKNFKLSRGCCENLLKQKVCQYTGVPVYGKEQGKHSITFERVNNDIGYVDGNVILVSEFSNSIKSDFSSEELLEEYLKYDIKMKSIQDHIERLKASIESKKESRAIKLEQLESSYNNVIAVLKENKSKGAVKFSGKMEQNLLEQINNIDKTAITNKKDIVRCKNSIKQIQEKMHIISCILNYNHKLKKAGFLGRVKLNLGLSLDSTLTDTIDSFIKSSKTWRDFI